jgi:hypothetical protein
MRFHGRSAARANANIPYGLQILSNREEFMSSGSEMRQRSESVRLRLTPEEYTYIGKRAEECGMTVSAFLRAVALDRRTRHITTSRVIDALVRLGNEQRRIGGLIKHLRGEDLLTANERVALLHQIEVAQRAVIAAIGRIDHAGEGN